MKVSKYGVFSGPIFPCSDQKKLRFWTFFTLCLPNEYEQVSFHSRKGETKQLKILEIFDQGYINTSF